MITSVDVDLATPAMIGGSRTGELDAPAVLRPPSLRGALRFWTRALCGERPPALVEAELWGSIERGQGVAVLPASRLEKRAARRLFPHRFAATTAVSDVGSNGKIRFHLSDERQLKTLAAVVWTWIHLGTVGRRGRRGYGSLLWRPVDGDLLTTAGYAPLIRREVLAGTDELAGFLREGLARVQQQLEVPRTDADRMSHQFFRLDTLDQIFVGRRLDASYDGEVGGMEHLLHGLGLNGRGPQSEEMGTPSPRLASPMLWRAYPALGGGYIPVLTWSPLHATQIARGSGMHSYLSNHLGFHESLAKRLELAA